MRDERVDLPFEGAIFPVRALDRSSDVALERVFPERFPSERDDTSDRPVETRSDLLVRSFDLLERSFDLLDRSFDPLDRSFDPLDRSFDPLDRSFDPLDEDARGPDWSAHRDESTTFGAERSLVAQKRRLRHL